MTDDPGLQPDQLAVLERALSRFSDGYTDGLFRDSPWGVTIRRSTDGKRVWLYGEELAGKDFVSFNFYRLSAGHVLKPCEMSSAKIMEFVREFEPIRW